MALILVLISLTSALPIIANAGDAVFLETLINTDKYTYVANLTRDTKNKNKKYAYKYMNMAYLLGQGCDVYTSSNYYNESTNDGKLNSTDMNVDPNYCFRLDSTYLYSSTALLKNQKSTSGLTGGKALDMFLLLEGYVDSSSSDASIYITDDNNIANRKSAKNTQIHKSKAKKQVSPLSYPGWYTETVTTEQVEYAQEKLTLLVASLNGILTEVNAGQRFSSVADLVNKSILIRPDNGNNTAYIAPHANGYPGYFIVYADLNSVNSGWFEQSAGAANRVLNKADKKELSAISSKSSYEILNELGLPRANTNKELYAYVFPITTDKNGVNYIVTEDASMFVYAVPKGFSDITNGSTTYINAKFKDKGGTQYEYIEDRGDSPWISIHMLSFYANNVYKHENLSVTTYANPESNLFTNIIVGLFNWILDGIRNVLGLASIEELVFNLGARGSAAFNFGLMSENWWNVVLQYQLVFQAIAWVMLVCGFIKMLIDLNLSSINPQKRQSVYDTVQKFIVVGIGLVILIPCTQFLLECNDTLVELFASQIETSKLNMPSVSNALVQILVGVIWITILLYINFLYIMRSITVALLIASGPFFIATMAFSANGKSSLFTSWAKELLANIFVQSVHAFVLSFLVQLLASGTFLETFAIAISIIPITETFRGLIFAGAGSSTSNMATTAAGAMKKMGTAAVKAGIGVAGGVISAAGGGGDGGGGSGGSGGSGGKEKNGNALNAAVQSGMSSKLDKMANKSSAGAKLSDKMGGGKGAKIAGGLVDAAGIAGLALAGAASHMGEVADIVDNMGELALKGDYNAAGKAVESAGKLTTNLASNGIGTGKAAVQASKNAKNRKAANAIPPDTTNKDQSGGAAQNISNGTNENGGEVKTQSTNGSATVSQVSTKDFSTSAGNITQAQQAQALKDYMAAAKEGKGSSTSAEVGGRKGTQYNFTDKDGKQQSFFMDDKSHQALIGHTHTDLTGDAKEKMKSSLYKATKDKTSSDTDYSNAGVAAGYKKTENDISGTSVENRQAALKRADEAQANGGKAPEAVQMKDENGNTVEGQKFTYTSNGQEKSFVMSNSAIKEARSAKTEPAKHFDPKAKGHATVGLSSDQTYAASNGSKEQNATSAMAALHGKDMGVYYGSDGKEAGHIYDYNGQQIAVSQEQIGKAEETIANYTQEKMANGGVTYQQKTQEMVAAMAERNGMDASSRVVDLSHANTTGQYTDAAMAASIGTRIDNGNESHETYRVGEGANAVTFKVPKGLGQSTSVGGPTMAQSILKSRGINQVKNDVDNNSISYSQSTPQNTNNMYGETRTTPSGGVVTQMNTNIGKAGGPQSFTSDGNGGGTMKFANRQQAMTYFQSSGSYQMADKIGQMSDNTSQIVGSQRFRDEGDKGFSIDFDGSMMKEQGMSMSMHSDGKSLLVASTDNQPKDPFQLNTDYRQSVKEEVRETQSRNNSQSSGSTVEDHVNNSQTPTENPN